MHCGITTAQFPDPPTNLTVVNEDSQLILDWDASTIPDLGGYLIYYGTVSCDGTTNKQAYYQPVDVGNVCQYTLTGLENEITYYLAIRAYNTNHYPGEYGIEIPGEPLGMGYQFLPQSVIIPMGGDNKLILLPHHLSLTN
ncbi:MAG: fibronectin type III domain-containing protein [Candidatus Desantisbacteria bacterium]